MTTINVTQDHIDRGQRGQCLTCPVARAILPCVKKGVVVEVFSESIFFRDRFGQMVEVGLPLAVTGWIVDFDNGDKMQPFSFDLDIPADFLAEGGAA